MTLLLSSAELARRREVARGALAPLARSLAADLAGAMALPLILPKKARLTRRGGRCGLDGSLLEFDPSSPHDHRCSRCATVHRGEDHDGWWAMGLQLWLAERAVHAAALHALLRDETHASWATSVLQACVDAYPAYPNSDNVLGPSRPFFSTYLESLWLLHLCIATDLLESSGAPDVPSGAIRDELVEPSSAIIASFDEGDSNRQVWNAAALVAANRLLERPAQAMDAVEGAHGVLHHLSRGLLADGSWYEGENYHQFAQRGLWYGLTLYESMGGSLSRALQPRWRLSALTPFLTASPDLTMPARRDSQWRVSLRQWRFAEIAELGFARAPEEHRLARALSRLYAPDAEAGDTGRSRSTGEAERNVPPVALSRAELGWRSLLFARPELPDAPAEAIGSVLLPEQGFAIVRRDDDKVYAALDYGKTGGGHGHPDRLDILLHCGHTRWFDDPGTGSYTDPSLAWYRSSLAHQVPLIDGRTQARAPGRIVAFRESKGASLVDAVAEGIYPGARVRRAICVMTDYMVDELTWSSPDASFVDLPMHALLEIAGTGSWTAGDPSPRHDPDAGYAFLRHAQCAPAIEDVQRVTGSSGEAVLDGWIAAGEGAEYWRASTPGPPYEGAGSVTILRIPRPSGRMLAVWSWGGSVVDVQLDSAPADAGRSGERSLVVHLHDGSRQVHSRESGRWKVEGLSGRGGGSTIELGGGDRGSTTEAASGASDSGNSAGRADLRDGRSGGTGPGASPSGERRPMMIPRLPDDSWGAPASQLATGAAAVELGEDHWRGTEQSWQEAGAPTARVRLAAIGDRLAVEVDVRKEDLNFASALLENPLDNEHPDINSDGIQLHMAVRSPSEAHLVWLLVPEPGGSDVRVSPRTPLAAETPLVANWRRTRTGWALRADVPLSGLELGSPARLALDVLVNEMPASRERRRGQLVLSGARGDHAWLRGDRQEVARYVPMQLHG